MKSIEGITIEISGERNVKLKESIVNKTLDYIKPDIEKIVDDAFGDNPFKLKIVDSSKEGE